MPRPRKNPFGMPTTKAIIGSDVDEMLRMAKANGPWWDEESCRLIAEMLGKMTHLWRDEDSERKQREAVFAAKRLRTYLGSLYSEPDSGTGMRWLEKDLFDLDELLRRCLPILQGNTRVAKMKPWVVSAHVISEVVEAALEEIGVSDKRARNGIVVRFMALALTRVGYASVTEAAVAKVLSPHWRPRSR